jgi:hypothetical protein
MDRLFKETISRIEHAPLLTTPFSHLMIENIFPATLYADLLKNLPDTFYYRSSKHYPQRSSFPLSEDNLTLLEGDPHLFHFWSHFKREICGDAFLSAILDKFHVAPKTELQPIIQLIKDRDHYAIGPHTDIPQKMISLLFYLPSSNDQTHLGTSLYRPLDPQFISPDGDHLPFEQFVKVGQAPFFPNFVFGFLRTDTSFHGVEPIATHEKERNLLSYTVWAKQTPLA